MNAMMSASTQAGFSGPGNRSSKPAIARSQPSRSPAATSERQCQKRSSRTSGHREMAAPSSATALGSAAHDVEPRQGRPGRVEPPLGIEWSGAGGLEIGGLGLVPQAPLGEGVAPRRRLVAEDHRVEARGRVGRRPAELLQLTAALLPGVAVEGADRAPLIQLQPGGSLDPGGQPRRVVGQRRRHIPETRHSPRATREQESAIGAERHRSGMVRMPHGLADLLAGGRVPEPRRLIPAPNEDDLAVGAERH